MRWGAGFLSVPSCCPPVRRHHFLRARHWRWADRRRSAPVFFFVAGFWVGLGAVVCCGTVAAVDCGSAVAAGCGVGFARTASFVSACRVGSGVGLGTCLRPVQCKGSGKHHGSHHNGQDYFFFFIAVFLFYIWGRCGISLPRCNAVRRWSGHPAHGAGSAAAAGFHPPLPARGPYRHS